MEISQLHDTESVGYYQFIESIDDCFVPRLSERQGGIEAFIKKIDDENGKVFVSREDQRILGSISYWVTPLHDIYVWLIAVAPEYRGAYKGLSIVCHLIHAVLSCETALRNVEFTTWSTNSAARKLYRAMGLRHYRASHNDMGNRTTLHYRTSMSEFYPKFYKLAERFGPRWHGTSCS